MGDNDDGDPDSPLSDILSGIAVLVLIGLTVWVLA